MNVKSTTHEVATAITKDDGKGMFFFALSKGRTRKCRDSNNSNNNRNNNRNNNNRKGWNDELYNEI
jgi:hypothetical protein